MAVDLMIHTHIQKPILDLILLSFTDHVLHGHIDIIGRRNVTEVELVVLWDVTVVWIIDDITNIKVAVKEDRSQ